MVDLIVVRKALIRSLIEDSNAALLSANPAKGQDSMISLLIYDIFGGEILKTRKKKRWHFYNMVEGLRIDFTSMEIEMPENAKRFEDIPCHSSEIIKYCDMADYSSLYMKFVMAFEEIIGLKKYHMA